MPTIDPVKLRPGMKIVTDGNLFVVTEFQHRTPGNLRSFVVCKLRGFADGRVVEKTFRGAADWPEQADFEQRTCTYLYNDQDGYHFMDSQTYEQFSLDPEMLGFQAKLLAADAEVIMAYWNGKPVGVELPPKMVFTVVETMETVSRGNTSGNIMKDATLDTGYVIQVPAFIKQGDKVRVSTADGTYVERA
jgi:elongation factor P